MGSVIERHSVTVDGEGFIHYDDQPSTWERAEGIVGRLDRRKRYAIIHGEVCQLIEWTEDICECDGPGCWGYCKGKRRRAEWVPLVSGMDDLY